ncbi:hypothetical protein HWV62_24614 [Athelia sp. TMB]|nr:hypothetical protein HWV62_24614 [Athelia sp. TMB]
MPDVVIVAHDALAITYLNTALVTVLAWDIIICFKEELVVTAACGFSPSIVAYFVSRSKCKELCFISLAINVLVSSASSFLFLLRVRAVFGNSKLPAAFFGIFWLAIPAIFTLTGISGHPIYDIAASRCFFTYTASYASAGLWLKAAYDTSIFIAISVRIASYSMVDHVSKLPLQRSFRGAGLPLVCRDLLYGGQLFYFVTVGVNVTGACGVLLPVASVYGLAFAEPAIALESIMACRVFRRVVRSSIRSNDDTHSLRARYESGVVLTTILPYAPHDAPITLNEDIS